MPVVINQTSTLPAAGFSRLDRFTIKQGDIGPVLQDTLTLEDGTPINLTGATVQLAVRTLSAPAELTLSGAASVVNPTGGVVQYQWGAGDTATPGMFMGTWIVTFTQGPMTFPTAGYLSIHIEESLAGPVTQLVSLTEAKDYLNVQDSDRRHDEKLIRFIHAVRPIIEDLAGPIIPTVFEEWHDGGQAFIRVRRRPSTTFGTTPILDLIGISEFRGPTEFPLALVESPSRGSMYSAMLDSRTGMVVRRTSGGGSIAFPSGQQTVHVVYRAGQKTVPANVAEATLELLRVNYQTTQQVGRGRLTVSDEEDRQQPHMGFFIPGRVRELLGANRRAPSVY